MAAASAPKKYGLVLGKQKAGALDSKLKLSAFAAPDDDSDEPPAQSRSSTQQAQVKKHVQSQIERAYLDDPSIFEYDAIYDDLQREKSTKFNTKREKDKNREPKYVRHLLKAAQQRQHEHDAREERRQATERAKEGDAFAGGEVFVTSTYRRKMEELDAYKEQEERRRYVESVMDVTQQSDISGFYKHMLNDMTSSVKDEVKDDDESVGARVSEGGGTSTKVIEDDVVTRNYGAKLSGAETSKDGAAIVTMPKDVDAVADPILVRLKNLGKLLARKNDAAQIEAYRQRYFERKSSKAL